MKLKKLKKIPAFIAFIWLLMSPNNPSPTIQ